MQYVLTLVYESDALEDFCIYLPTFQATACLMGLPMFGCQADSDTVVYEIIWYIR